MKKYRPEIDGLRALAILPVILFHAGFTLFSGGFVGVDVFFVISGYLITSIILAEKENAAFSLIAFYERRARRILPALFFVMLASLPFAWFWLMPTDLKNFSESLIRVPLFWSNVFFYNKSDYFDISSELKPLLHTWSLSVEEQYYLIFPIFLLMFWRFGTRFIVIFLFLIFLSSFSYAQYMVGVNSNAAFFLLPSRFWEILIGAFIAFYYANHNIRKHNHITEQLGSLVGFIFIVYSIFAFNARSPFPGFYALVPTAGAALIIIFATNRTFVGKLLSNKLMLGVGLVSYSAYLWHQPLFAFARHRNPNEPSLYLMAALIILTFILAYLTWKYIERPFRNKHRFNRKQVFIYAFLASFIFIVIGFVGKVNKGFVSRMPVSITNITDMRMPRIDNGWCFYSIDTISELKFGDNGLKCYIGDKHSKLTGIIFGDSFAGHYEPFWDVIGKKNNFSIHAVSTNWCYPSFNAQFTGQMSSPSYKQCIFNRQYLERNLSNYSVVILSGMWGKVLSEKQIDGVLELIAIAAAKSKIVILMPSPKQYDSDITDGYKKSLYFNYPFDILRFSYKRDKEAIEANRILKDTAKKYKNVIYLERDSLFSANGKPSDLTIEKKPFNLDGSHISVYGSIKSAESFMLTQQYKDLVTKLNQIR